MTGVRRVLAAGPAGLVGHFIEVRTLHGAFRGRLLGIKGGWLEIQRHTTERPVLVPLSACTAMLDEESAIATARGERGEQDESGHYAQGVDEEEA
jgi:hypothetical protein